MTIKQIFSRGLKTLKKPLIMWFFSLFCSIPSNMSVIGSFNKAFRPRGSRNFLNNLEFLWMSLVENLKTTLQQTE